MSEKKSLVEEALLQMKNLEHVVTENAKGILASTMKEEIEELVKESLDETEIYVEDEDEVCPVFPDKMIPDLLVSSGKMLGFSSFSSLGSALFLMCCSSMPYTIARGRSGPWASSSKILPNC